MAVSAEVTPRFVANIVVQNGAAGRTPRMPATVPGRYRGRASRDAAAFYLSQLARGILSGELEILSGQEQTVMATSDNVILHIDVKRQKRINRIHISLCWPWRPSTASLRGKSPAAGESRRDFTCP
jgi:amphi-Trp domain-containing protein